ncbi:MAG: flagellar assembly protein FliW [Pseudomonadota bacterium]
MITFIDGLPGFDNHGRYALLPEENEVPVFYFLQSIDDPDIAFTVSFAQKFGISYDDTLLSASEMRALGLGEFSEAITLLFISENRDHPHRRQFDPKFIPHITHPVVVNPKTRKGLYKELPGVQCSATVSAVSEKDGDPEKAREDYLRFLAMMQVGIKAL